MDFSSFDHMEEHLRYKVGPLASMILIPMPILTYFSYQHLIYNHFPVTEKNIVILCPAASGPEVKLKVYARAPWDPAKTVCNLRLR